MSFISVLKCFVPFFVGYVLIQVHLTIATFYKQQPPHIIFILADDLGWNDVSFHGSPQIPTPNLDALASSGIVLNNHYTECLCTPSRGSLMTGKYPIRLGLQHLVIRAGEASGLPLNMKIMPQYLKNLGYDTHIVGKWHLGYMQKEYTPIYRGFDSFFGMYNGMVDYYDYTHYIQTGIPSAPIFFGVDLRNGKQLITNYRGKYSTHTFTEKATNIIRNHNPSKPLFLYLAPNAAHTGNKYMPLQAPPYLVNRFDHIKNESRKVYAGMVSGLDDLVGSVFAELHRKDILKNSVIVFLSDNGGEAGVQTSSNYPLRGWKFGWWEGGIRAPALLWSPLLGLREPKVSMQLMHMSDWLPTLYSAAGGNVADLGDIDGHNMWNALINEMLSPRKELLQALDPINNVSVIRNGHFKLVTGNLPYQSESGPTGLEDIPLPTSMDEWVFKSGSIVRDILKRTGLYLPRTPDSWRQQAGPVRCGDDASAKKDCDPLLRPCLFNVTADPCENNNVAEENPKVVAYMMKRIETFKEEAAKPQFKERDIRSDPRCHGFAMVSWLEKEHRSNCPFEADEPLTYSLSGKSFHCSPFTPLECYRMYWEKYDEVYHKASSFAARWSGMMRPQYYWGNL
ncbi:hypothetical protein JTE90_022719 [Oedothorax gibbosus]|uniref:Sulfatase N-terminal domain-containing protein n=1 Tax=Oedothorax gibbosus TaxID=931172 RepID=A0AAV6UPL2_9ARAC|nr:hypothetical protein JTE90_022719 [Oedothorax gibbosus]